MSAMDIKGLMTLTKAIRDRDALLADWAAIYREFFAPDPWSLTLRRMVGLAKRPDPTSRLAESQSFHDRAWVIVNAAQSAFDEINHSNADDDSKQASLLWYKQIHSECTAVITGHLYFDAYARGADDAAFLLRATQKYLSDAKENLPHLSGALKKLGFEG